MRSPDFRPLRVTAHLRCGVVCDPYLPLDGILLSQAFRREHGRLDRTLPGAFPDAQERHVTMPLLKRGEEQAWYYACSFAYPQPWWLAEGRDAWNKRFDQSYASLVDFAGRRGQVENSKGPYRAYHKPIYYRVAPCITWFCIGLPQVIRFLLSDVSYIGKKRDQGWGNVIRWEVEDWFFDWSERDGDGKLTRALPTKDGILYGLRPPYWNARNQVKVQLP